jgi:hypothetical protein
MPLTAKDIWNGAIYGTLANRHPIIGTTKRRGRTTRPKIAANGTVPIMPTIRYK